MRIVNKSSRLFGEAGYLVDGSRRLVMFKGLTNALLFKPDEYEVIEK